MLKKAVEQTKLKLQNFQIFKIIIVIVFIIAIVIRKMNFVS